MQEIKLFNEERDWDQFHSPENLAKSIAIEAGELLECFQWNSENYNKEEVCEELADVFTYCIQMAMKLNVKPEEIILKKLEKTKKKYQVEKAKGESTKYKTVYAASGTSQSSSYNLAAEKKGDGVYETSNSYSSSTGAWFGDSFTFPYINLPFFRRSGHYGENNVGIFSSTTHNGIAIVTSSFRLIIII